MGGKAGNMGGIGNRPGVGNWKPPGDRFGGRQPPPPPSNGNWGNPSNDLPNYTPGNIPPSMGRPPFISSNPGLPGYMPSRPVDPGFAGNSTGMPLPTPPGGFNPGLGDIRRPRPPITGGMMPPGGQDVGGVRPPGFLGNSNSMGRNSGTRVVDAQNLPFWNPRRPTRGL